MTRRLTLLRHAKSSWDDSELADRDRPLNERGERDVPIMARRLGRHGVRPSLIISSPATRALQTVRLLAKEIGYPTDRLQHDAALYLASSGEILRALAEQHAEFVDILLCGHNPGLSELAAQMSHGKINHLPTCGAAVFESSLKSWTRAAVGRWKLMAFDYPKNPDRAPLESPGF